MNTFKGILTLIVVVIIVGLVLRYGSSSLALLQAAGSTAYQETALLTLANSSNVTYPYYGPGSHSTKLVAG